MNLTFSYQSHLPASILHAYDFCEVRNASAILSSTSSTQWSELLDILAQFKLQKADILSQGGNKSELAARLDEEFRRLGWREGRVDTLIKLSVKISPYHKAGESKFTVLDSEVINKGYKVDNLKNRVALDVEWNAKDGNLDRDLGAYRALYDAALIDAAVIITRTQDDLRQLTLQLDPLTTKFATTTTTNLGNLQSRLTRGDGGGCPILAIGITSRCYDHQ